MTCFVKRLANPFAKFSAHFSRGRRAPVIAPRSFAVVSAT